VAWIEKIACFKRNNSMLTDLRISTISQTKTSPGQYCRKLAEEFSPMNHPCLSCGACCAYYRASFYWSEADDAPGGTVPVAMTVQVTPMQRAMRGTDSLSPRCHALQGNIGESVCCNIYTLRASPCRDFMPSWENGVHNERCDHARRHWGLPPLQSDSFVETTRVA